MAKKRITVTVDEEVAAFLYTTANTSAVVSEAVREYGRGCSSGNWKPPTARITTKVPNWPVYGGP